MAVVTKALRILVVPEHSLRRNSTGGLEPDRDAAPGWIAVCLDHFLAAGGETETEAWALLESELRAEVADALREGRVPFAKLGPAPERYQRQWQLVPKVQPVLVPTVDTRDTPPGSPVPPAAPHLQAEVRVASAA